MFAAVAGPAVPRRRRPLGYLTLPKGLEILIGLTPADLTNLVEFGDYLTFLIRTLLVFGIAFEIPVFVILLNLAGVLRGKTLGAHRPWIVIGTFVFAAVATPSTDPFTMLILAVPMLVLFGISEVIARVARPAAARARPARRLATTRCRPVKDVDPFDLPDWLGEARGDVDHRPAACATATTCRGALTGAGQDDVPCDLLAVDDAYPSPVADDDIRTRAHLAWRHGQILLLECDGPAHPGGPRHVVHRRPVPRRARTAGQGGRRARRTTTRSQLRIGADRPSWEGSELAGARGRA